MGRRARVVIWRGRTQAAAWNIKVKEIVGAVRVANAMQGPLAAVGGSDETHFQNTLQIAAASVWFYALCQDMYVVDASFNESDQ